ncbi:MAG TPA: Na+/H+ antiporter NhaA [Gaiellaceae bacterium]|nr:Na+/H+ antiporter NhaA [Gaiellaceae bacterium]
MERAAEAQDALAARPYSGRTAWVRSLESPLRSFLRTETGSAAVLLAAAVSALVWANAGDASYERVWRTTLSLRLGGWEVSHDLRYWLNSGLMTLFFLVVGLEARREFDLGELRDRRRLALPLAAGLGGMLVPVAIFVAFNAGSGAAHGWGVAMSTDTAFALGMLALVGRRFPLRLRAFMLTFSVVDDVLALVVIATVYASRVRGWPLVVASSFFALAVLAARVRVRRGLLCTALGAGAWVALSKSGVDPIAIGLAMGLLTYAAPAARTDLERATDLFRLFREQPTPELARTARAGVTGAISPNERLQQLYHPWTSYAIVPLFALANAGVEVDAGFLARAFSSPVTLGILVGYVAGKPAGVLAGSRLATAASRGRVRPPIGWAALAAGGTIAGIGFTVSLLIAELAFDDEQLAQAKVGILAAALCASLSTWLLFRGTALLPRQARLRALVGPAEPLVDLAVPVDPERDHVRGPEDAPVTLVEYGDFECPFCGQAERVVRELLRDFGDLRYVWRHLPLNDVHPHAQLAAEAAEAAGAQGGFWPMYDLLLTHQGALDRTDLLGYAGELGLDLGRFAEDLDAHAGAARIAEDVDGADLSGVSGTPTFFVNGRRHYGAYDVAALSRAVRAARARAAVAPR